MSRSTPWFLVLLADLMAVMLFAGIGRANHAENLLGIMSTAWPFLLSVLIGWGISQAWRAPTSIWPTGLLVWACTVGFGMLLRVLAGGGFAFSFLAVTASFLALLILGMRSLFLLRDRLRSRAAEDRREPQKSPTSEGES